MRNCQLTERIDSGRMPPNVYLIKKEKFICLCRCWLNSLVHDSVHVHTGIGFVSVNLIEISNQIVHKSAFAAGQFIYAKYERVTISIRPFVQCRLQPSNDSVSVVHHGTIVTQTDDLAALKQ